ncbi:MAG TPA: TIGR02587 family membrane protein [Thermomicrobiales bacterium]|nr:TIGR02587 family membrane protein [Thermomicrobiales bacterium]
MGAWAQERDDFIRAFSGAYIFGIPLLFTMEMWWIGQYADLWKLLVFLGLAFAANLGLTYAAGFKRRSTFGTTVNQAVDAVAVGIVAATIMLLLLNQIRLTEPLDSIVGKIVVQAVPLSIGASVANQIFGKRGEKSRQGESHGEPMGPWHSFFSDVGATIIGGIFIGFSIAPTDEVPLIASALDYHHLVAVIGFSLLVSYMIVFASGFDQASPQGLFQRPFTETMLAYLVSLLVSFLALYLFDQIEMGDPVLSMLEKTLVLGVPATVGGAAGRLVI